MFNLTERCYQRTPALTLDPISLDGRYPQLLTPLLEDSRIIMETTIKTPRFTTTPEDLRFSLSGEHRFTLWRDRSEEIKDYCFTINPRAEGNRNNLQEFLVQNNFATNVAIFQNLIDWRFEPHKGIQVIQGLNVLLRVDHRGTVFSGIADTENPPMTINFKKPPFHFEVQVFEGGVSIEKQDEEQNLEFRIFSGVRFFSVNFKEIHYELLPFLLGKDADEKRLREKVADPYVQLVFLKNTTSK